MADAVIVSTARTPIGKAFRGAFNDTQAQQLGAHAVKHAVQRAGVDPAEIEDALLGHPDVLAAAAVPVADERWGQVVAAAARGGLTSIAVAGTTSPIQTAQGPPSSRRNVRRRRSSWGLANERRSTDAAAGTASRTVNVSDPF